MSGTRAPKAQAMMGGGGPARAEQRQPPGGTSTAAAGSLTSTSLGVPSTAGSQQRRPNARWAAVGEASEASRDADVTVAHAHAQRHGCLSARWAQTCAPRAKGTTHAKIGVTKVRNRDITLTLFLKTIGLLCLKSSAPPGFRIRVFARSPTCIYVARGLVLVLCEGSTKSFYLKKLKTKKLRRLEDRKSHFAHRVLSSELTMCTGR